MTRKDILHIIDRNHHAFFTTEFLTLVNGAFGADIKPVECEADPDDPQGLVIHNGADRAVGIAAFNLAPQLCRALGVSYLGAHGRGTLVHHCIEALRASGRETEVQ